MASKTCTGPSDSEWDAHRATLERLYWSENLKLDQVRRIMKSEYGFIATSNQYQRVLRDRWKLKKKTKSTNWKSIAPHVLAIQRTGKAADVVIDGQRKTRHTVLRETKRYTRGDRIGANKARLPPLPSGVIVRAAASPRLSFVATELPFQYFERQIYSAMKLGSKSSRARESGHVPIAILDGYTPQDAEQDLSQALQAVVPHRISNRQTLNSSSTGVSLQTFASPIHRSIMCSIANNFAGTEFFQKEDILKYLKSMTTDEIFRVILSKPNLYTTQALTANLFMAAIEEGDCDVLSLILANPHLGTRLDKTFQVDSVTYTPLERAAYLGHSAAVRVLLKYGADVKFTTAKRTSNSEAYGVFDLLVHASLCVSDLDPELLRFLLKSGASPVPSTVKNLCSHYNPEQDLILLIIQKYGAQSWSHWNEAGVTLTMFERLKPEILHKILSFMIGSNVEMSFVQPSSLYDQRVTTILDAAARRGDLSLFIRIYEAGVEPTLNTLLFAIEGGREELVEYMLKQPGCIDYISCPSLTPLGAAIRSKNKNIVDLISSDKRLMDEEEHCGFESVLLEASHSGNLLWVRHVLEVCNTFDPGQLGEALAFATAEKHQNIALVLLSNGADPNVWPSSRCSELGITEPPLCSALRNRDYILVRALLDADANPNYDTLEDSEWPHLPAIELAAISMDKQLIQMVINAGARACPGPGRRELRASPLNTATKNKNKDVFEYLIECGCAINQGHYQHFDVTVLFCAVETKDINMVQYVLDHGADPHDEQALRCAAFGFEVGFDLIVKKHRERYRKGRPWGADTLCIAIQRDKFEIFQKVLSFGGNPCHFADVELSFWEDFSDVGPSAVTAFGLSIARSERIGLKYAEHLLQNKAKWNCNANAIVADTTRYDHDCPVYRSTAFLLAIETAYRPVIDLLLKDGANVNFPAEMGVKRTPLQKAAEIGHLETVQLLLDKGADFNAPPATRGGGTALQLAALKGNLLVARLLLEHGADVYAVASSVDGRTALEGAAENGRLDVLQLLLSAAAATDQRREEHLENAREIALAHEASRPYIVEILDNFIRDGSVNCYSSGSGQDDNDFDAGAAKASFHSHEATWRAPSTEDSVMSDVRMNVDAMSGSLAFEDFLNFDAIDEYR